MRVQTGSRPGTLPLQCRTVAATGRNHTFVKAAICPKIAIYAISVGLISAPFPSYGARWLVAVRYKEGSSWFIDAESNRQRLGQ